MSKRYIIEEATFINGIKQPGVKYHQVANKFSLEEAKKLVSIYRDRKVALAKNDRFYEFIAYGFSQHRSFVEYVDQTRDPGDDLIRIEFNIIVEEDCEKGDSLNEIMFYS